MSAKEGPGIHTSFEGNHFTVEEMSIIRETLAREFFVTHSGSTVNVGVSAVYKYLLIKPTSQYADMFNLHNEIVVLFSQFSEFDSRENNAIEKAYSKFPGRPLERLCSLVISKDSDVVRKVRELRHKDPESQVLISFTYEELKAKRDPTDHFIRNRFRTQFYSQNLFDIHGALKKDMYFFGRTDLIHSIVGRHRANENSALFGLRRTGKTSVIYGVIRELKKINARCVMIDCQDPSFHIRRWNEALFIIMKEIKRQNNITIETMPEGKYTEKEASQSFQTDLLAVWQEEERNNILIIFDEIENITFNISPSDHWSRERDFIYFWQALRTARTQYERAFSYLIVGTNPTCVEHASINGQINPIFTQVPIFSYIQPFNITQTKDMVSSLGRMMGLEFEERLFTIMNDDYGGHPFLIRRICSIIHDLARKDRPTRIDRGIYRDAQKILNERDSKYFEMVLEVLKQFYPHEYAMLEYLAIGDEETFVSIARDSNEYTSHLLGYGILEQGVREDDYRFRIDAIKNYIAERKKYKRVKMKNEEKLAEISERRNKLEMQLRKIILRTLLQNLGMAEATAQTLSIFGEPRRTKLTGISYEDLYDSKKTEIYFEDLRKLINKNWKLFENIFERNNSRFDSHMQTINRLRYDAHAKNVEDAEFNLFRATIEVLERQVQPYL